MLCLQIEWPTVEGTSRCVSNVGISPISDTRHTIALNGMRQPLPEAYPEYCVVKHPQGAREFRVETKSYFQSRSAPVSHCIGLFDYALVLIFPTLGAVAWQMVCRAPSMPVGPAAESSFSLIPGF